jgi:hypothetical protein
MKLHHNCCFLYSFQIYYPRPLCLLGFFNFGDKGSVLLRNVSKFLSSYKVSHLTREYSSLSPSCPTTSNLIFLSFVHARSNRLGSCELFKSSTWVHRMYATLVRSWTIIISLKDKAIPVTGRCETSRLPHFLDSRLTDGGEVVSLMRRPPFTPRKIPGTHFC